MAKNPIGSTDLIGQRGVRKSDPRVRLNGALDEASAALSLAKSMLANAEDHQMLTKTQTRLSSLMGFVAKIGADHQKNDESAFFSTELIEIEEDLRALEVMITYPKEFIFPGDQPETGALDLARAVIRRAEREATLILDELEVGLPNGRQYLNRLSSLCYLLILKNLAG